MQVSDLLPIGIDFGFEGGIVALHGNKIALASKTPVLKLPMQMGETDDDKCKSLKSKSKANLAIKRFVKNGERKPRQYQIYDTNAIGDLLDQASRVATEEGYQGMFVAIEEPQMLIGTSSPKTYFASGRGQNAWALACYQRGLLPVWFNPKSWKRKLGLGDDKADSLALAEKLFDLPEHMKQDHDLCEAALLAYFVQDQAGRYLQWGTIKNDCAPPKVRGEANAV